MIKIKRYKYPIRNISLDMTEGCSLRCTYCFADLTAHKKSEKRVLTEEIMKAALDWFFSDEVSGKVMSDEECKCGSQCECETEVEDCGGKCSGTCKCEEKDNDEFHKFEGQLSVDLWGGEPLHNWEMVVKTVEYGKQKEKETGKPIRFGGTTNCIEITEERLKFMKEHNMNFLMSIDGVKESHDMHRKLPNGKGSWEIIDNKLDMILTYFPHWNARISLSDDIVKYLYKSFEYFESRGLHSNFYSPVYENDWNDEAKEEFMKQSKLIIDRQIRAARTGRKITNKFVDDTVEYILQLKRMNIDIEALAYTDIYNDKLVSQWKVPCGAGSTYLGISVDGQLYMCHRMNKHNITIPYEERVGHLGDVWKGITNTEMYNKIINWDVDKLEGCKKCKFRYECKGGCYASNYDSAGAIDNVHKLHCWFKNAYYELALYYISQCKEYGLYDVNNHKIIIAGEYKNVQNQPFVQNCSCYGATYTFPDYVGQTSLEDGDNFEENVLGMALQIITKKHEQTKKQ